jgi:hypothetical protein
VKPEGLGKLANVIYHIESRTRDLPACSSVPYSLHYRVPPKSIAVGTTKPETYYRKKIKFHHRQVIGLFPQNEENK